MKNHYFDMEQKKKQRNTLSASFWRDEKRVLFLEYVDKKEKAIQWVKMRGIQYDYVNFYNRKTREFIERIKY